MLVGWSLCSTPRSFLCMCWCCCWTHAPTCVHFMHPPLRTRPECLSFVLTPSFTLASLFSNQSALTPKRTPPPNHPNCHSYVFSIPVGESKGSSRGPLDGEYADSDMLEILRDISLFICARGMDRHGSEHGSFSSPSFLSLTTSLFAT